MDNPQEPKQPDAPAFAGEEDVDERATPHKDLIGAAALGALGLAAAVLGWRMPNPGNLYTAPGLFPVIVGLSLLGMCLGLAATAAKRGGADRLLASMAADLRWLKADGETRRMALLAGIVLVYIVLADWVTFVLYLPFRIGDYQYRFTSWELVTIPSLGFILRAFWGASWLRCLLASFVATMLLAFMFRYGFQVLLPGSG